MCSKDRSSREWHMTKSGGETLTGCPLFKSNFLITARAGEQNQVSRVKNHLLLFVLYFFLYVGFVLLNMHVMLTRYGAGSFSASRLVRGITNGFNTEFQLEQVRLCMCACVCVKFVRMGLYNISGWSVYSSVDGTFNLCLYLNCNLSRDEVCNTVCMKIFVFVSMKFVILSVGKVSYLSQWSCNIVCIKIFVFVSMKFVILPVWKFLYLSVWSLQYCL